MRQAPADQQGPLDDTGDQQDVAQQWASVLAVGEQQRDTARQNDEVSGDQGAEGALPARGDGREGEEGAEHRPGSPVLRENTSPERQRRDGSMVPALAFRACVVLVPALALRACVAWSRRWRSGLVWTVPRLTL